MGQEIKVPEGSEKISINGTGLLINRAKPLIALVLITGSLLGASGMYIGSLVERVESLSNRVLHLEGRIIQLERLSVDKSDLNEVKAYSNNAYHGLKDLRAELVSAGVIGNSN